MIKDKDRATKIAEYLLQIKAVKLNPEKPFVWSSGWKSPIYCDNRMTLSYPTIRTYIRQCFAEVIRESFGMPDMIAGVATGGIAIGALVAQELGLPFVYVRSSAKGHGLQNQIEGDISTGTSVVVIEDLISTGGSSLKAVKSLKDAGLTVKGVVAIFSYGFLEATDRFEKESCPLITLSDYEELITYAAANDIVNEEAIASLKQWRKNPADWKK